jgi:hypothetical protein
MGVGESGAHSATARRPAEMASRLEQDSATNQGPYSQHFISFVSDKWAQQAGVLHQLKERKGKVFLIRTEQVYYRRFSAQKLNMKTIYILQLVQNESNIIQSFKVGWSGLESCFCLIY